MWINVPTNKERMIKKRRRNRQTQRDRKAGVIDGVYTIIHLLLQERGENEKKRP